MKRVLFAVLCAGLAAQGQVQNIMFAGLPQDQAPELRGRYEQLVRERLTAAEGMRLVDNVETERLVGKTGLFDYTNVSSPLVEQFRSYVPESTLVVWGRVDNYDVRVRRTGLFGAQVSGSMSIVVTLYSLRQRQYVCVGSVDVSASVRKPPVFFYRADKVTVITAADRVSIAEQLGTAAADRTVAIIADIVQNQGPQRESTTLRTNGKVVGMASPASPVAAKPSEPPLYQVLQVSSEPGKPAPLAADTAAPPAGAAKAKGPAAQPAQAGAKASIAAPTKKTAAPSAKQPAPAAAGSAPAQSQSKAAPAPAVHPAANDTAAAAPAPAR